MNLAIFDFDADGGDHGFEGTGGQTYALKLRANPPDGVRTVRWDVWDLDSYVEGASALQNPPRQAGTTTELVLDNGVTTGQRVSALTPSDEVDITLPSETGVAWIVRCVVNNATLVDAAGRTRLVPEWVYQRMVYIPDGNGLRPIVQGELREGSSGGWVEPFNAALALIGGGGGAVSSVFGRTGAVVAAASDYNASQVDNDSSVTGAFVDDALDQLDTDLATLAGAALNAPADPADDDKVPAGASGNLDYTTVTIGATVMNLQARDLLTTGKLIGSNGLIMSGESAISVDAGDLKIGHGDNTGDLRLGVDAGQQFIWEVDEVAVATMDATTADFGALDIDTTGDLTANDADFVGDVTADTVDTSAGLAPVGYAVGLKNADQIGMAGASSGVVAMGVDASDRLMVEGLNDELEQITSQRTGGTRARQRLRAHGDVNTTDATPTELTRLTLPDGWRGPVLAMASAATQVGETSNYLVALSCLMLSTVSGSAVIIGAVDIPNEKAGTADSTPWNLVPSTDGLDLVISGQGQASGTVEWSCSLTAEIRPGLSA